MAKRSGAGLPKKLEEIFWERGATEWKSEVRQRWSTKQEARVVTRSSLKEHMENALASGAEEGRDKLRKAAGSCK